MCVYVLDVNAVAEFNWIVWGLTGSGCAPFICERSLHVVQINRIHYDICGTDWRTPGQDEVGAGLLAGPAAVSTLCLP